MGYFWGKLEVNYIFVEYEVFFGLVYLVIGVKELFGGIKCKFFIVWFYCYIFF